MVEPKDNFLTSYNKQEIEELKTTFDSLDSFKEKLRFFIRYFGLNTIEFTETLARFEFPFPKENRHQPDEVDSLEKILSSTTFDHLLTKTSFGLTFSVYPTDPLEWDLVYSYLVRRVFLTREQSERDFWERLAIVPEQGYFIEAQIQKFDLFDHTSRRSAIPFHTEYYSLTDELPGYRPHLNRWNTLFAPAYFTARKEGLQNIPTTPNYLYELYFMNLGFVYAHYLGFLKRCLTDVMEKGHLTAPLLAIGAEEEQGGEGLPAGKKGEFSHKSQILLLHRLGIFNLAVFQNLTDIQRGKLFGRLLNRSIDNTENYIRYRNGKDVPSKYALANRLSSPPVDDLLRECGLENL